MPRITPDDRGAYDAVTHEELAEKDSLVQYVSYSRPTTGWFGSETVLERIELEPLSTQLTGGDRARHLS